MESVINSCRYCSYFPYLDKISKALDEGYVAVTQCCPPEESDGRRADGAENNGRNVILSIDIDPINIQIL